MMAARMLRPAAAANIAARSRLQTVQRSRLQTMQRSRLQTVQICAGLSTQPRALAALAPPHADRLAQAPDIFSRLLEERIIYVTEDIQSFHSSLVIAQLLYLESINPEKGISMYINCAGGPQPAVLAIHDCMQYVQPAITTVCVGHASGLGSLLVAAGAQGQRYAMPHAQFLLRQPSGGAQGQASDIAIRAEEIKRSKEQVMRLYAQHCNKPQEDIEKYLDRDFYLSAQAAVDFGLIDEIVQKRPKKDEEGDE